MKTQEEISELAKEDGRRGYERNCFIDGYTQCQEDMADKKYTEESQEGLLFELILEYQKNGINGVIKKFNINSLNKQD